MTLPSSPNSAAQDAAPPADPWAELRRHTPARIALGRAGSSLPTAELLRFAAAHAQARDAVHIALDTQALARDLARDLAPFGLVPLTVRSRAPDREAYLRRPDWGRRLDATDAERLQALACGPVDLAVVVGDGLSAVAVQTHAASLLAALLSATSPALSSAVTPAVTPAISPTLAPGLSLAPLVIATQARVALADEIGALLQARLVLILLGERPGLSAPDSLGAYLTHGPQVGCHDAQRNCVSNIRPAGLPLALAAQRLAWLLHEALRRRLSGVALKDDSGTALLAGTASS